MMRLPSGRVIDLSTSRAKYHALRHGGIGALSEHRKLYALVDIVYRFLDNNETPRTGWTEYDYEYSGYTLDSVRAASDWPEEDKKALVVWALHKAQKRIIETARRRLQDNQKNISIKKYSAAKKLHSILLLRLKKIPMQRATAEHWLATITNQKKKGIRDEEIQWSGLTGYLGQHPPDTVISKTELVNKLNDKNIRIELSSEQIWGSNGGLNFKEVAFRMAHQVVYRSALKLDENCLCILRYVDTVCNYRVGVVKTLNNHHAMALNKYWFALDSYGRAIVNNSNKNNPVLFFDNSVDAKLAADTHARDHFNVKSGANPHTRFDHLTLYGGYDYREWLVSLPDFQRTFFGAHFYDHNILAHIRTTTRSDLNGRRILFIEEVQSDWHQSGKRYGYDNHYWGKVANAPYKQEWPVLAVKLMLIQASENGYSGIAWSPGEVQEMRYRRELKSIKEYYDKLIPGALNKLVRPFHCQVETTTIKTRDPWLNLEKQQGKWRVADAQGKFKTKAKYNNRDEAMAVIARHCRIIDLEVPVLFISEALRQHISVHGLPSFGHITG